jgi:hypothetical protein
MSAMMVGCAVSAGPAPIPLRLADVSEVIRCSKAQYLHASTHEAVVRIGLRSPNTATKADQGRCDQDWPSSEACLNRNPDEVAEAKHKNSNTCELNNACQIRIECFNVVSEHGCLDGVSTHIAILIVLGTNQRQRSHSLREGDESGT